MAPREATGTFPDQYLTFDYDVANMGMQMPPHDPFPAATAADVAAAEETVRRLAAAKRQTLAPEKKTMSMEGTEIGHDAAADCAKHQYQTVKGGTGEAWERVRRRKRKRKVDRVTRRSGSRTIGGRKPTA